MEIMSRKNVKGIIGNLRLSRDKITFTMRIMYDDVRAEHMETNNMT